MFDDKPPMHIEPPGRPAQLAMIGGTILATIRELKTGGGALVAYERAGDGKGLSESWRVALPADAWGIAVSPDGTLAAVTSAWTGKVSLVDLSKHEVVWTRDVGREPRGIAFVADGDSIFVSHLVEAPITRIDKVRGDATITNVDLPAAAVRAPSADKLTATLGYSVVISPDGSRAFFPRHALGTMGSRDWNGSAAVDVLDVAAQAPIAPPHQINGHIAALEDFDPNSPKSQVFAYQDVASDVVVQGAGSFVVPRAAVYRPSQRSLLIASEDSSSIVELDALMSDPTLGPMHSYSVSSAPTGIALSRDGNVAFVYCRAADTLEMVHLARVEGPQEAAPPPHVTLADPPSDKIYGLGRAAFYSQCSSCHPEGRDDGHVWHEVQFGKDGDSYSFANLISTVTAVRHLIAFSKGGHEPIAIPDALNVDSVGAGYARQTPMLVNRVKALGPYGWRGLDEDLNARILHGFRLHQWG
jgi:DNA-binding beta-propeller fold protein YncE